MKLSDVKKLHQKKYRAQFGFYLVEGEHLVLELLSVLKQASTEAPNASGITLYATENYRDWVTSHFSAVDKHYKLEIVTEQQMQQLSDTPSPQGIIARVPLVFAGNTLAKEAKKSTRYVYLYEVQDPGNLGTILRTLAWFGNFTLLLSPNSVDPFNSKVVRASMGAIFHVDMELNVPLETLNTRFSKFAYLDMQGNRIGDSKFADYECYLFGNEARGVPSNTISTLNADAFTINGSGKIDSLNLASAVNICAYELSR